VEKEERERVWCEMEEERKRENVVVAEAAAAAAMGIHGRIARYPADLGFYPADSGSRDAILRNTISRDVISRNIISCDVISRDVISYDIISRDDTHLCDIIPHGPLAHCATATPTIDSCIPELEPALYTYLCDWINPCTNI